jgi:hypothetical protein
MRLTLISAIAALTLVCTGSVFAQDAPAAVVNITENASMLSLKDNSKVDTFKINLSDYQVITDLTVTCSPGSAGHLGGLFGRQQQECAVGGNGKIIDPKNAEHKIPRTQYGGSLKVEDTGDVDGSLMNISYTPTGQASFSGMMVLKPEHPSQSAMDLTKSLMTKFNKDKGASDVIDDRTDTIALANFCIPSAGFPGDKGTCWKGDGVYSYQKSAWYFNLTASFGGKDYQLQGNMPWIDSTTTKDQAEYDVTLVSASPTDATADALFATDDPNSLFAASPGITGTLTMAEGGYTDYNVKGKTQTIPYLIDMKGTLTGTQVPVEVVRSFATLISVASRAMLGA